MYAYIYIIFIILLYYITCRKLPRDYFMQDISMLETLWKIYVYTQRNTGVPVVDSF